MMDRPAIGNAFQHLTTDPRIDSKGFCLQSYLRNNAAKRVVKWPKRRKKE